MKNNINICLFVIPVVLIFTIPLLAAGSLNYPSPPDQDIIDIIEYFPAGEYSCLTHVEYEAINKTAAAKTFYRVFGSNSRPEISLFVFLPAELQKDIESFSWGEPMDIKVSVVTRQKKLIAGDSIEKKDPPGVSYCYMVAENRGAKELVYVRSGHERFWVIRYFDLDSLIKTAVKKGALVPTGKIINDRMVYSSKSNKIRKEYFFYPTLEQHLLAAEKLSSIVKMIDVKDVNSQGLVEDDTFKMLSTYSQDLGQFWHLRGNLKRAADKHYEKEKEKLDPKILPAYEMIHKQEESEEIYELTTVRVSDEVKEVRYQHFDDKELARSNFEKQKAANKGYKMEKGDLLYEYYLYSDAHQKAKRLTLDGENVVTTVLFDKSLVKKSIKAGKAYREFVRERIKNSKEESKGK